MMQIKYIKPFILLIVLFCLGCKNENYLLTNRDSSIIVKQTSRESYLYKGYGKYIGNENSVVKFDLDNREYFLNYDEKSTAYSLSVLNQGILIDSFKLYKVKPYNRDIDSIRLCLLNNYCQICRIIMIDKKILEHEDFNLMVWFSQPPKYISKLRDRSTLKIIFYGTNQIDTLLSQSYPIVMPYFRCIQHEIDKLRLHDSCINKQIKF